MTAGVSCFTICGSVFRSVSCVVKEAFSVTHDKLGLHILHVRMYNLYIVSVRELCTIYIARVVDILSGIVTG